MTLAEALRVKLANWRPTGEGRHSCSETFPDSGWAVRVAADQTDAIGCLVWELDLGRIAEPPPGLTLATWASEIASRVGGLLEDLKVVEIDDPSQQALLRSDEPTARGDDRYYYEVLLTGLTGATVRRFRGSRTAGGRREQVAFALTHEVLSNLIGDIAG
jgi:hypothetical protein